MSHEHSNADHKHHNHQTHPKRPLHQDWRLWTVVVVMLVAMAVYVMTMDEAVAPGVKPGAQVPAAAP
jgi:hypothetical protein